VFGAKSEMTSEEIHNYLGNNKNILLHYAVPETGFTDGINLGIPILKL
jgi:hypothetical protein